MPVKRWLPAPCAFLKFSPVTPLETVTVLLTHSVPPGKLIIVREVNFMRTVITAILSIVILTGHIMPVAAQVTRPDTFERIELLEPVGDSTRETDVRIRFGEDEMQIESTRRGGTSRTFKYSDIRSIEYSYTKNPRWKTGLGLGATSLIFPPMLLIAIPLGFTKHRRHWVTIRGEKDYAVLKVSKGIRKIFIPALETHSKVRVEALGENK